MKKKLLLLILGLMLVLTACGKKDKDGEESEETVQEQGDGQDVAVADGGSAPVESDPFFNDGTLDFDTGADGSDQTNNQDGPTSTNMLPQSSTGSKFTGKTESSGWHPDSANKDNFHHIGKPVVTTPSESTPVESTEDVEQQEEHQESQEQQEQSKTEYNNYQIVYDGYYKAEDLEPGIYGVMNAGADWSYEYVNTDDEKFDDSSKDSARFVLYFNTDDIQYIKIEGSALIYLSDENIGGVTNEVYTNSFFKCGRDFEPGEYEFLENGSQYYVCIYKADGSMNSMKSAPLPGITYSTIFEDGDYVYMDRGVNMIKKVEDN